MIVDRLKNYKNYAIRNDRLDKAFGFLIKNAAGKLPEGRYDIEGDKIYALVQKYVTEPADEKNWEAHVRHIDLQYMAGGQEVIQWAELEDVAVCAPYNDDNDYALFEGVERTSVKMEEGFLQYSSRRMCTNPDAFRINHKPYKRS